MNAYKIGLISFLSVMTLVAITTIGKPRKPLEPLAGAFLLVIVAAEIFCVVKA